LSKIIDLNSLIEFYKKAYFPMADSKYSEEIKFYKPKLRFIIPISNFHYPKKLFSEFKKTKYSFKIDQNFAKVIELCKEIKRKDQDTWINKLNNTDRNRSNRNGNNRMRNSNRRNNYQNDSFETYKFNFGKFDGVRVANIISSICNSTNINGRSIGKIQIFNDYSLVDLPRDLHRETKNKLKKIKVRN